MIPVPPIGYGGIERIVDSLVRQHATDGHTVGLMARAGSRAAAQARFAWPDNRTSSLIGAVRNALSLRRAVTEFRPDVVHSFSRLAYLTPILRRPIPKLMSYQRHTGGKKIRWAATLAGGSLQFTGCSEFISDMGRRAGGKWDTVPNFVEVDRVPCSAHVASDAPLVFLSRIERIKGPDLAIKIARAASRRLILAGNRAVSGPERNFWEREIAPHLESGRIDFVGEVDDAAKHELLVKAAALLVPVQWDEPFGIVFVEALAAGTPVISCRRGAVPEIVEHGRTGFLITGVDDGIDAVRRVSTLSRQACRDAATSRFSAHECATKYLGLYQAAIT